MRCDAPIGNLATFQEGLQRRFGVAQICDATDRPAIPEGLDMASVELARQKASVIDYPVCSRKKEAAQAKD